MNPAMYMLLYSCKNHPQVKTKRRCRSCARPICSACIYKANRHLFCSNKCHKKYHFITLPKLAGKHLLRKWKALPRGISVRSAITSATILALSGYMIFALIHIKRLESRVTALSYQLALLADTTQAKQKGNASPAKNTETPVVLADNGVMINEQTLNIAGQAKQHSMATLTLGDKMQQSQMITDGSFAFQIYPFLHPVSNISFAQSIRQKALLLLEILMRRRRRLCRPGSFTTFRVARQPAKPLHLHLTEVHWPMLLRLFWPCLLRKMCVRPCF